MNKIYVIDDDRDLCDTFSDILLNAGYEVHVSCTGADAFKRLPKVLPDVILLDMQMPDISGVIMLSFIRRMTRLKRTKVIIVSGHPEMAKTAKAIWGIDMFLEKPVSAHQLLSAVAGVEA